MEKPQWTWKSHKKILFGQDTENGPFYCNKVLLFIFYVFSMPATALPERKHVAKIKRGEDRQGAVLMREVGEMNCNKVRGASWVYQSSSCAVLMNVMSRSVNGNNNNNKKKQRNSNNSQQQQIESDYMHNLAASTWFRIDGQSAKAESPSCCVSASYIDPYIDPDPSEVLVVLVVGASNVPEVKLGRSARVELCNLSRAT